MGEAEKTMTPYSRSISAGGDKPTPPAIPSAHVPPSSSGESIVRKQLNPPQSLQAMANSSNNSAAVLSQQILTQRWSRYIVDEKGSQVYTMFKCLSSYSEQGEASFLGQVRQHLFGDPRDPVNQYESFKIARYHHVKSFWPEIYAKQGLVIVKFEPNERQVLTLFLFQFKYPQLE